MIIVYEPVISLERRLNSQWNRGGVFFFRLLLHSTAKIVTFLKSEIGDTQPDSH